MYHRQDTSSGSFIWRQLVCLFRLSVQQIACALWSKLRVKEDSSSRNSFAHLLLGQSKNESKWNAVDNNLDELHCYMEAAHDHLFSHFKPCNKIEDWNGSVIWRSWRCREGFSSYGWTMAREMFSTTTRFQNGLYYKQPDIANIQMQNIGRGGVHHPHFSTQLIINDRPPLTWSLNRYYSNSILYIATVYECTRHR